MSIGIVDTTIFCEILQVPRKSQQHDSVMTQLREHIKKGVVLFLPIATIIETGNHIAQNGDGYLRRKTAERFSQEVRKALDSEAPWTITRPPDVDDLRQYLDKFPDYAMQSMGLGDVSIVIEFERQCKLHPHSRVFIWSLDGHLKNYIQQGDF
jgi:hypothetical protein